MPKSSRCEAKEHHSLFQVNSFRLSCSRGVTHVESMPQVEVGAMARTLASGK